MCIYVTNVELESKLNSIVQFGSVNCMQFFERFLHSLKLNEKSENVHKLVSAVRNLLRITPLKIIRLKMFDSILNEDHTHTNP